MSIADPTRSSPPSPSSDKGPSEPDRPGEHPPTSGGVPSPGPVFPPDSIPTAGSASPASANGHPPPKAKAGKNAAVEHSEADVSEAVARLQRNLDEVRGTVASLVARIGDDAMAAGSRSVRQARELAGNFADDLSDRAGDRAAALRGRIEDQPISSVALAFFGGMVAGAAVGVMLASGQSDPPRRMR